jgi:hypothetical protein
VRKRVECKAMETRADVKREQSVVKKRAMFGKEKSSLW